MEGAPTAQAMSLDVWFCLIFATATVLIYALWCFAILPRVRLLLALVGVVSLGIAISMRHDLFAAAPTKPSIPLALTKDAN
jgi:hypothetical protein